MAAISIRLPWHRVNWRWPTTFRSWPRRRGFCAREDRGDLRIRHRTEHACEGETSVMMAIARDIVKEHKLDEATVSSSPGEAARRIFAARSFSERAPITGTWGDPRSATAEKGARFLSVQAEALAEPFATRRCGPPGSGVAAGPRARDHGRQGNVMHHSHVRRLAKSRRRPAQVESYLPLTIPRTVRARSPVDSTN